MKNSDLFTKRFMAVCLGISAVLISGSLFIFSLKTITATHAESIPEKRLHTVTSGINLDIPVNRPQAIPADTTDEDIQAVQAFGLGMRDGVIYFGILYNNNTVGLHKTEFNSEDILHW